ncbi:RNA-directed DNA polymerase from mobile element jockey [Trichonephila clavipes]|nr:RNA-directed DNA polymerase from mobile element jockey [Trichonephila clavipes]
MINLDTNTRFAFPKRNVTTDWEVFRDLLSSAHHTFQPITARTGEDVEKQSADLSTKILDAHTRAHRDQKVQAFQSKLWEDDLRSLGPEDGSLWEISEGLRKKKSPVCALNGRAGIAHTDSDKAEVLACSLESQFQDNISNDTDYLTNRVVENYFLNENNFYTPLPPPMPSEILKFIKNAKYRALSRPLENCLHHSYPKTRTFAVRVNDTHSSIKKINSGAPQGALLSPTLFNIFVNDIPKTRHTTICLFADDTAILAQSASKACVTHFLHKHLAELEDWYKKWKIAINPTKTEAVFSNGTSARPPAPVHVQNHPVPWSKTVKYLGVILDQHLSFNPHIVNAKKKFRALACIYSPYFTRNSPLSLKNRMLIYTSIIRSVLLYACPVWGHAARGNINILEQSQNVIIRQITNSPWFVRNADLRFALRLKTIKATIKKIAEKFFNNLETIDNRTLRKIESYTPDPKFNRPRNILLPDHTPNRVTASPLDRN